MSKALSLDLRTRVLAAVAGGLSHRQAGERFGVSAASVSRWREETPDITLEEMRQALVEHGHVFGFGTIQRFFKRHQITRKKRARTPASRTARTS